MPHRVEDTLKGVRVLGSPLLLRCHEWCPYCHIAEGGIGDDVADRNLDSNKNHFSTPDGHMNHISITSLHDEVSEGAHEHGA